MVSEADVEVDGALRETLLGAFPQDAWLSEEAHDDRERLLQRRVWIVDPLDGTREFLQGVPEYAVSIALAFNGEAVLGVVYNPGRRRDVRGERSTQRMSGFSLRLLTHSRRATC